jgi:hypothetical protein
MPDTDPPPPRTRLVHVPDNQRATYVREPGDIVLCDAQISALARLIGPAIERSLAKDRAREESGDSSHK